MITRNSFFKCLTMGVVVLFCGSCGQGGDANTGNLGTSLQQYQARPASFQINGTFPDEDQWRFLLLSDDRQDTIHAFSTEGGKLSVNLENVSENEVYYLQIKGKAKGYESDNVEWAESLPVLAQPGAVLTLVAVPHDTFDSLSKLRFRLQGGGEEQDFLETWFYARADKRAALEDQIVKHVDLGSGTAKSTGLSSRQFNEQVSKVSKDFISQAKPLVSTLYLISMENNHRSQLDHYRSVFEKAPAAAQSSKYGVDLNNRIVRITEPSPAVDFEQLLAARNSQLLPFNHQSFSDKKYLLLVFWSSRLQGVEGFDVSTVSQVVPADRADEIAVLHFALDTKMSEWKPVTDKLNLSNSYMVRAEVRQAAIDHFYLTELPRFMILKPDGTVIENDIPFEALEETVGGLE